MTPSEPKPIRILMWVAATCIVTIVATATATVSYWAITLESSDLSPELLEFLENPLTVLFGSPSTLLTDQVVLFIATMGLLFALLGMVWMALNTVRVRDELAEQGGIE